MQVLTITRSYLWDERYGYQGEVGESRALRPASAGDQLIAAANKAAMVARFCCRVGNGKATKKQTRR